MLQQLFLLQLWVCFKLLLGFGRSLFQVFLFLVFAAVATAIGNCLEGKNKKTILMSIYGFKHSFALHSFIRLMLSECAVGLRRNIV